MNCENRKIILSAYLDGEVTAEEKREIEEHLKKCSVCSNELKKLQKISSLLKEPPKIKLSSQFEKRLKEKLNISSESDILKKLSQTLGKIKEKIEKPHPEIMTIGDLSSYLQISVEAIWRCLREIPSFKIGDQLRFRKKSIDEWLRKKEASHYEPYEKEPEIKMELFEEFRV